MARTILHIDLDAFYCAVEENRNPSLRGKAFAVGGKPDERGVVSSCSYAARQFGVRSAMPTSQALRLCPQLVVVRGHFHDYSSFSDRLYRRMLDFAPIVERASIDEMFLDFTGTESLYHHDLEGKVRSIQKLVLDEFQLPCTIGLASNKTIAKIATDQVKPAGLKTVPHGQERAFLAPLPVNAIPGVGKKTDAYLQKKGFRLIADLQGLSVEQFTKLLGKHGVWLHRVVHGGGSTAVHLSHHRKSIGKEETFSHDVADLSQLEKILYDLVEGVCGRLRAKNWKTRTVTLKIRYSDFKTITRAETIRATNDDPVVFQTVCALLRKGYTRKLALRLLGVQLSHFVDEQDREPGLFDEDHRRTDLLDAVERIRKKFGNEVIHVGRA